MEKPTLTGDIKDRFDRLMIDWRLYLLNREHVYRTPESPVNFYQRVWIFKLAAIFALLAVVGSVGEATFQLKQSKLQSQGQKREGEKSEPSRSQAEEKGLAAAITQNTVVPNSTAAEMPD
jgi:hypothetical protein